MSNSIKAALWSALIFPGAGQISSGYKKRGWIIIGTCVALLYLIISEVMTKANEIFAQMQKLDIALDIDSILNASSKLSRFSDNTYLKTLMILFIISWLFSIFDAYRTGVNNN